MVRYVIDRYLVKEISLTLASSTSVLVLIIFGNQFVRLLASATEGQIAVEAIMPLLVLGGIESVILLLPVSFLLAVMLTMGRLYRDNEIIALRACGISDRRLYLPVMMVALPLAALLAWLSLYVSPWTVRLTDQITAALEGTAQLTGITSGRFIDTGDEAIVLFVEGVNTERGTIHNVFIHSLAHDRTTIETASRAVQRIEPRSGDRIFLLQNGARYEGTPGRADFRILSFNTHTVRIPVAQPPRVIPSESEALPTSALWGATEPARIAELQWRVSVPVSVILLALLALPLSYTTPRRGRFGKLALGIAIYIGYANLGLVTVSAVERGAAPWLGIWWSHAFLLALTVCLFIRQYGIRGTLQLLSRPVS